MAHRGENPSCVRETAFTRWSETHLRSKIQCVVFLKGKKKLKFTYWSLRGGGKPYDFLLLEVSCSYTLQHSGFVGVLFSYMQAQDTSYVEF